MKGVFGLQPPPRVKSGVVQTDLDARELRVSCVLSGPYPLLACLLADARGLSACMHWVWSASNFKGFLSAKGTKGGNVGQHTHDTLGSAKTLRGWGRMRAGPAADAEKSDDDLKHH